MKECPKCKAKNRDGDSFCLQCGTNLKEASAAPKAQVGGWDTAVSTDAPQQVKESGWDSAVSTETISAVQNPGGGKAGAGAFIDQSEGVVATVGSSYLQSYLTGGGVGKGIGILTQKRFYYKGRNFIGEGKTAKSTTEEGVVSIEDISGTMFCHTRHIGALIWGVFGILAGLLFLAMNLEGYWSALIPISFLGALAALVSYFVRRHTLFVVNFAGGGFAFNVHYYPISDMRDFQRQIHLLKDHIKGA